METEKSLDFLVEKINSIHSGLVENSWQNLERNAFENVLEKTVSELKEMKFKIREIKLAFSKYDDSPDASKLLAEFDRNISTLERNLSLERGKSGEKPKFEWAEKSEKPELYSSLEQNVLALILRCRYFVEKCLIFERRQKPRELELMPTAQALMDLLKQKENEIETLREKYSNARKQSFLGLVARESTADLEEELNAISRNLQANFTESKKELDSLKKEFDSMQHSLIASGQKYAKLHESIETFEEKNAVLSTGLKKERDYAKKVMMESEHETLKLRNSYTKEILNLQEAKLIAKKETEEKSAGTINTLKKELAEKDAMLRHLKENNEHYLKKLNELEDKNKKLRLLMDIKERHEMAKERIQRAGNLKAKKK